MESGLAFVCAARRVRDGLDQSHRFAHVIRVARFAERLAVAHGEDPLKARLAGLYHDLARLYTAGRLIDECTARGLTIDAFERANPIVLHARLGAEIARDEFGISDEAMLSAIRKHTVAAVLMNRLDVIIYLADALEPGREYAERSALAALALRDLDAAMRGVLDSTIAHLRGRGLAIAPQTLAAQAAFATPVSASVSASRLESLGSKTPFRSPRSSPKGFTLPDLLTTIRTAAEDKKGEDISIIDLEGRTIVADSFVVVTGRSKIQTRSIADAIIEAARANEFPVARTEGYNDGGWILIDLGPVIAHVFTPDQRQFYNLERLWGRAAEARAQSS